MVLFIFVFWNLDPLTPCHIRLQATLLSIPSGFKHSTKFFKSLTPSPWPPLPLLLHTECVSIWFPPFRNKHWAASKPFQSAIYHHGWFIIWTQTPWTGEPHVSWLSRLYPVTPVFPGYCRVPRYDIWPIFGHFGQYLADIWSFWPIYLQKMPNLVPRLQKLIKILTVPRSQKLIN